MSLKQQVLPKSKGFRMSREEILKRAQVKFLESIFDRYLYGKYSYDVAKYRHVSTMFRRTINWENISDWINIPAEKLELILSKLKWF